MEATIHDNLPWELIHRKKAEWFDGDRLKLLPASEYLSVPHIVIQAIAAESARYVFPTVELVDWLRARIGNRTAIEIGAGQGDLGIRLGVKMTDNYCQTIPLVTMYYQMLRQRPTQPPKDVERLDALEAIKKYKPQVVFGGFITHRFIGGNTGNQFGPIEEEILANCQEYIMIGNEHTHKEKPILRMPHETIKHDWLITRAAKPSQNVIWSWKNENR